MLINIFIYPGMTMLDAMGPYEVLSRLPGARIQFVSLDNNPITSDTGFLTIIPNCDVNASGQADVLLIPGGPPEAVMAMAENPDVQQWLLAQHAESRFTTSVCTGALMLVISGIISKGEVSTHWAAAEAINEMGVKYSGQRITQQGKILTAAGVSAGIDMALALCAEITDQETSQAIQLGIEYDPAPPFDYQDTESSRQAALDIMG